MLTITNLTCEYQTNPMGIDIQHPRMSWQIQSDHRGTHQAAFQVMIAANEMDFSDGTTLVWDSGRIESDQSIHFPYTGPPLKSGQRVFWKVRVWDQDGSQAESPVAWWEMGLLEKTDWSAQWIGAPFVGDRMNSSPSPYLRKEFTLEKPIHAARLCATAVGLYECSINGSRIGDSLFTPGWTDYTQRIHYQVYDITPILHTGRNAIGAILGDGWGAGHIAWLGRQHYTDRPKFYGQVVVVFSDGSRQVIPTDRTWKVSEGPILTSDLLMGESYDACLEMPGWTMAGFDDSSWHPVELFEGNDAKLVATNSPPVKRQEELKPIHIRQVEEASSRWIFDLGQNMVGWVRLVAQGEAGTMITFRYAEALGPDNALYTQNLRTARNTDRYIMKGDGIEIWEPHFTFHGFRYVEVDGLPEVPTQETITGIVIHSDMPSIGSFTCSDPLINQLQQNIVWGQKGNFLEVPTDCPQRDERMGYTGDAQVFARTAAFNRNVAGFFTKWLNDVTDAQLSDGTVPPVAPILRPVFQDDGGPAWADAIIIVPWTVYQFYGDKRILAGNYTAMQKYVEFLSSTSKNGIRCYEEYPGYHGYGDWLALDGSDGREGATSKELIGTAFYANSTKMLSRIARVLGKEDDASRYHGFFMQARQAFNDRFVAEDGSIVGNTQTSYVLALEFDLLPENLRLQAANKLVKDILRRNGHLSTGFVGTPYINWVLSDTGHLDTAYDLLMQKSWPSWLYSVTQGGTTIWERWDGWTHDKGFQDAKMNSFNHYAYGAIGAWMYSVIGGIDFDPAQPGYKHIIMHPQPGGGLTYANTAYHSMYGDIRSAWSLVNDTFLWEVSVPPNTSATLYMPAREVESIQENGQPLEVAEGVEFNHIEKGSAVIQIQSGDYHFVSGLQGYMRKE